MKDFVAIYAPTSIRAATFGKPMYKNMNKPMYKNMNQNMNLLFTNTTSYDAILL